jgi:amino acid adenylation domain-containing protein
MIHGREAPVEPVRLHELFERQADRTPAATAVHFAGEDMSYAQLDAASNQVAHRLARMGVGRGAVVVICLPPGSDQIVALLATLKAGAAYLPVEPDAPPLRVEAALAAAAPSAVITVAAARTGQEVAPVLCLDAGQIGGESDRRPCVAGDPDDLAYLLCTSGSTGTPKCVEVTHRGVVNYVSWAADRYQLGRGTGCPLYTPLSFDLAVTSVFCPLLTGRQVHVLADNTSAAAVVEAARLGGYSMLKLTPGHLQVLDYALTPEQARRAAPRLVVGGEALHGEMPALWRRAAPDTVVVNEYGPTEATVGCCVWEARAGELPDGPVPIGRPIANTSLYVVSKDDPAVPCAPGETGELLIGGLGLARGYRGDPELTARKFVQNPFDTRWPRLYRSGDLVSARADGVLEFRGRADDQLKVRGHRVEPGEIEAALRNHPAVRAAVVTPTGTGAATRLSAYLTGPATPPGRADLRTFLATRLPPYMIPDDFHWLDVLPLTDAGKVDRTATEGTLLS